MPTKGTRLKSGERNLILSNDFYNRLRQETGLELDNKTLRQVILESNREISNIVSNSDDAFKLPEQLGYIVITKYKSNKKAVDWKNTKKLKKVVYLPNLHTFNYIVHIKWFKKSRSKFGIKQVYKFEPSRDLSRTVARYAKEGKNYTEWDSGDFWDTNDIYKKINKHE